MCLIKWIKNLKNRVFPPRMVNHVYILENEIQIPIVQTDDMGHKVHYSYSYGYENGWFKICLWGGSAWKKECEESEVESIIAPIRDLQLNEHQVYQYLQSLGGFEHWNYYTEYYKSVIEYY